MSKITEIENAIIQLGPGEFQKFCDTFLSQKHYGKITGLGMKSGTLKTTIGNPDTYFRKENGKYICVAYTAQQSDIFKKLKEDIEKCLDPEKTKLPIEEIDEIICCHTSSNLLAGDDHKLHKLCEEKNIKLTIFGVDEIAQQIYRYYPMIAKDFFGISADTNQIMYINEFVSLYDSNEMAAPLDTIFHGRKEELSNLIEAIRENSVVIVHGSAGTGKTRIALEAIRRFSSEDEYRLLCVKNNNQPIYEDLIAKIDQPGSYLLFVDDANELSGLAQIIQYITRDKDEYSVKVVLTVRDYAKEPVFLIANKYTVPKMFSLLPFSDNDIKEFLNINMGITNDLYVDQIIKIAEGNPRIAYMTGKIAKDTQSLSAVNDASQVYEQYYSNVVGLKLGKDRELCLTAGILALVNAVFLDRMEYLENLLELSIISEQRFKDCIYRLSQMEVVEIHKDQVAAISDQCLSNYMLYFVFFKEKLLPFSEVLYVGYKYFKQGVIRSIKTLFNIFSEESLCEYIADEVKKVWNRYEKEKEQCFDDFVLTFHTFRPEQAFLIAAEKIQKIQKCDYTDEVIDFKKSETLSDDNIVGLLSGYSYSSHIETAVELLIEYVSKSVKTAIAGFNFLKNAYGIDQNSYRYQFYNEKAICNVLLKYADNNIFVLSFILETMKEYLKFEFSPAEMGRGNTFRFYHLKIDDTEGVKEYRELCWKIITNLSVYEELKTKIEDFLKYYAVSVRKADESQVVVDDKKHIDLIMNSLRINKIRKALILRDLYYGWSRQNIEYMRDEDVFASREWKLLTILDDDFIYSGMEYEDFQNQREINIQKFASEISIEEIPGLIKMAVCIADEAQFEHSKDKCYTIAHSLGEIAKEFCNDSEKTKMMINAVMENSETLEIYPGVMMTSLFKTMSAKELFDLINAKDYIYKNKWKFYYFELIPEEMVDEYIFNELITYLKDDSDKDIKSSSWRKLRFLDKFVIFDKDIYITASKIIFAKREYSRFIVEMYFTLLFDEYWYTPKEVLEIYNDNLKLLRDIYFFMLCNDNMVDLKGTFLLYFLHIEKEWIDDFANHVADNINSERDHDNYRYMALWRADEYLEYYDCIFKKLANSETYISEWRLTNLFKSILFYGNKDELIKNRQEAWIMHIIEENAMSDSVIIIFEALSEADIVLRKKALLLFLSINDDYELFKKIPLDPSHWEGNAGEIVFQLTKRIDFLESLISELKGVKYLRHVKRIRDRIEMWKSTIKEEELRAICRKLYQ